MNIGCACLVFDRERNVLALDCAKGRGLILPGGKWEKGETFRETALRELFEETGLRAKSATLVMSTMSVDESFVHIFRVHPETLSDGFESREGRTYFVPFTEILKSFYGPVYDLLGEYYIKEVGF